MTTPKTMLPTNRKQIEQLAREQQRGPGEVLEEAVRRYAAACRLERIAHKMGQRARDKGIREEDVPRLVEEVRRERSGIRPGVRARKALFTFCAWPSTAL